MHEKIPEERGNFPLKKHLVHNVALKTLFLLIILNLLFAWVYPLKALGRISMYNQLFPGRERLPYGDNPDVSYNLSLYNLEAMYAAHRLAGVLKQPTEFRVVVIGDSATWGYLLKPDETLAAYMNASQTALSDGRKISAYNLGYPVMSLTKDLLLLKYAMRYQPDLVIWLVTLESFPLDKQLFPPLLRNNPLEVEELNSDFALGLDDQVSDLKQPTFWARTIVGSRRQLADMVRLQLYGPMWAATGIDHYIPTEFEPPQADYEADPSFHGLLPPRLQANDLALDVIAAGFKMASPTEIILVNEPMYISRGKNSDIRYNFYYPRWAYDDYRHMMQSLADRNGWRYYDLWDSIKSSLFSNTAVHLTPTGSQELSNLILKAILEATNNSQN